MPKHTVPYRSHRCDILLIILLIIPLIVVSNCCKLCLPDSCIALLVARLLSLTNYLIFLHFILLLLSCTVTSTTTPLLHYYYSLNITLRIIRNAPANTPMSLVKWLDLKWSKCFVWLPQATILTWVYTTRLLSSCRGSTTRSSETNQTCMIVVVLQ